MREYVFVPDANTEHRIGRDYEECPLFKLEEGETLMDIFTSFSLENESPFSSDTDAGWEERWLPHLPSAN